MSGWNFKNRENALSGKFSAAPAYKNGDEALRAIFKEVQARIAARDLFKDGADRKAVIEAQADEVMEAYQLNAASQGKAPLTVNRDGVMRYLLDNIIGWGPLAEPMKDQSIEDFIVLSPELVIAFRAGATGWERLSVAFDDGEAIRLLVNHKIDHRGTAKSLNETNPRIDAQLEDGSRLHAIMSPLTVVPWPVVTIRRFRPVAKSLPEMVDLRHMTSGAATLLKAIVKAKLSCCIIGGTGSGKTTLANAMLSECGEDERIVTCEDTPEIQIPAPFWTQLTTRQPTRLNSDDSVDMAQLVKENLRMRPDRIIIGEARGPEMGAILQAGNTGHSGILFTIHANDPWTAVSRMETLALTDKTLSTVPIYNLRQMISMALNLIIHVGQVRVDGQRTRRLLSVTELRGMSGEQVAQEEILKYDKARGLAFFNAFPHEDTIAQLEEACPGFDFQRDVVGEG